MGAMPAASKRSTSAVVSTSANKTVTGSKRGRTSAATEAAAKRKREATAARTASQQGSEPAVEPAVEQQPNPPEPTQTKTCKKDQFDTQETFTFRWEIAWGACPLLRYTSIPEVWRANLAQWNLHSGQPGTQEPLKPYGLVDNAETSKRRRILRNSLVPLLCGPPQMRGRGLPEYIAFLRDVVQDLPQKDQVRQLTMCYAPGASIVSLQSAHVMVMASLHRQRILVCPHACAGR